MITAEMETETGLDVDSENDSEYECSPELIQIFDDMDSEIASGALKPQTVEEVAAELGIKLD
ncbi:MAG: hypothetical protein LBC59_03600 [Chitinispirillales bacterium]|jgi:hypothetical protein|nr:hypothetical protein [Chitinispirillales bacterium]